MLQQWKLFLENTKQEIIEKYIDAIAPKLSGRLLYHFFHSDSYEVTDFDEARACCSEDFRSISTFYHREQLTFYYMKKSLSAENIVGDWLALHQFTEHNGMGDWNLPNTWGEALEEWIRELRDFNLLKTILDPLVDPPIKDFFHDEYRRYGYEHELDDDNPWYELYLSEFDDGAFAHFMWHLEDSVIDFFSEQNFYDLKEAHGWFYLSHKYFVEKRVLLEKQQKIEREKLESEARQQGRSLLPEFRRRLNAKCGLIVPYLRFSKDSQIWPQLKMILESFPSREIAAIVFVTESSRSVRGEYLRDFGLL